MTTEGEETTTATTGEKRSQRAHSKELYGLSMERAMFARTSGQPPPIDVKEHSEQEILKKGAIGWKLILTAIPIIGLGIACAFLALELSREKKLNEKNRQDWTKKEKESENKWKEISKMVDSAYVQGLLLESKQRLEANFENIKKDEEEYLEKERKWESQLVKANKEISELKELLRELQMDLEEANIRIEEHERTNENLSVSFSPSSR